MVKLTASGGCYCPTAPNSGPRRGRASTTSDAKVGKLIVSGCTHMWGNSRIFHKAAKLVVSGWFGMPNYPRILLHSRSLRR